jgi:excinuclease ABC subunit A
LSSDQIRVVDAHEHNLKGITLALPRRQIIVVTGLSGSGKSSLVFDTIYAEAQRRFLESMSAYARGFLENFKRPAVRSISGLGPSISIDQKTVSYNPRSTVGTVTETYDYLRLLFAKKGIPHCPIHHRPTQAYRADQVVDELLRTYEPGTRFYVLSPQARQKKGEFAQEILKWRKLAVKARIDGQWVALDSVGKLAKSRPHDIDLLIDQLVLRPDARGRIEKSLSRAFELSSSEELVVVEAQGLWERFFSKKNACPECGWGVPDLDPRFFSFNSPKGACPTCRGLGTIDIVEEEVRAWRDGREVVQGYRYTKLKEEGEDELGNSVVNVCPDCQGQRLRPESLAVLVDEHSIWQMAEWEVTELYSWVQNFRKTHVGDIVAQPILKELEERLRFLNQVGCGYLSLARSADTLSGGEAQRLRLAAQLGLSLTGVLYVLDEPSIGLHPRDHRRLLDILESLREQGNTILMVEHDEETIRSADWIVELGPGAGVLGGKLIANAPFKAWLEDPRSLTAPYIKGEKTAFKKKFHSLNAERGWLRLKSARYHNLKSVNLELPIGRLVGVTGVSGSGKSSLILDCLWPAVASGLGRKITLPEKRWEAIEGVSEFFERVIEVDQRPIGRTSRSNAATYVDLAPLIRDIFAELPEAKVRGYAPGRFSYNNKEGQCPRCTGLGSIKLEMNFLADAWMICSECEGARFNRETLRILYKGKSIADVFNMTVAEAREFFSAYPLIRRKLDTLLQVGLHYLTLGQGAPTLSGGEAQRVKLSLELSKRQTGRTLYILDEPTTGLHFEDVKLLIELLQHLVDLGNTVVVIEHNLDVLTSCDYLVELGPGAGCHGGEIIFQGYLEDYLNSGSASYPTWPFLKEKLSST